MNAVAGPSTFPGCLSDHALSDAALSTSFSTTRTTSRSASTTRLLTDGSALTQTALNRQLGQKRCREREENGHAGGISIIQPDADHCTEQTKPNRRQVNRIDVLPDDVLLEIFDFYVDLNPWNPLDDTKEDKEAWQSLVHVCRRWRSLVFLSSRRLKLRLFCTSETPAKDTLDVWPALPLLVTGDMSSSSLAGTDNVIAALGRSNHVREVFLWGITGKEVLAAMQVPFPELTKLALHSDGASEMLPVIPLPDSFLGGSAQSLLIFDLRGIPFPGLPKLLLSSTHLLHLWLENIPHSGYISPEAIVALLSVLSSLITLSFKFQSPQSHPDSQSRSLPPPKRSILPALSRLDFKGVTEYLEEFVTRIDTPQLDQMHITFFNQIDFYCPRLAQFIICTPTLRALDEAHMIFTDNTASVELRYRTSQSEFDNLEIAISCREPDWQLSSIEQACNSSLHPLSMIEDLYIEHRYSELVWKNDAIENTLWLELLLPFATVKNLYLSKEFAPGIVAALKELVGGGITGVLPRLENIFVQGLFGPSGLLQRNLGRFVSARQLSGHQIAVSDWDEDSDTESI